MPCGCGNSELANQVDDSAEELDSPDTSDSGNPICVKCFTFWLIVAILTFLILVRD